LWMIKLSKEPQRESCFLCGLLQHVVWISESEETIPVLRYLISEGRHLIRLPHGSALSGKHNRPSSGGSSWNASFRVLSICAFDCSDGSMPRMYRKPWRDSGLDSDGSGPGLARKRGRIYLFCSASLVHEIPLASQFSSRSHPQIWNYQSTAPVATIDGLNSIPLRNVSLFSTLKNENKPVLFLLAYAGQ